MFIKINREKNLSLCDNLFKRLFLQLISKKSLRDFLKKQTHSFLQKSGFIFILKFDYFTS